MSRNGSGVYSLPAGNPVVTGTTISSTWANTTLTDIANSLTQSVSADGQTPLTGSLQLGGFNLTNMGAATTAGNAVEYTQFQTPTFTGNVSITSTGFLLLPVGTTAQRPGTPANGEIRYNSDYNTFEGYNGSWGSIGGGATGGGNDQVFVENGVEVTTSYTLPSGKNAMSVGPITIDAGATITVPSGQRWVIF